MPAIENQIPFNIDANSIQSLYFSDLENDIPDSSDLDTRSSDSESDIKIISRDNHEISSSELQAIKIGEGASGKIFHENDTKTAHKFLNLGNKNLKQIYSSNWDDLTLQQSEARFYTEPRPRVFMNLNSTGLFLLPKEFSDYSKNNRSVMELLEETNQNHFRVEFPYLNSEDWPILEESGFLINEYDYNPNEIAITNIDKKIQVIHQLLVALSHLKKERILHRDLKPSNIYINEKTNQVKIGDWTTARELPKGKAQLISKKGVGTINYFTPYTLAKKSFFATDLDSMAKVIASMFFTPDKCLLNLEDSSDIKYNPDKVQKQINDLSESLRNNFKNLADIRKGTSKENDSYMKELLQKLGSILSRTVIHSIDLNDDVDVILSDLEKLMADYNIRPLVSKSSDQYKNKNELYKQELLLNKQNKKSSWISILKNLYKNNQIKLKTIFATLRKYDKLKTKISDPDNLKLLKQLIPSLFNSNNQLDLAGLAWDPSLEKFLNNNYRINSINDFEASLDKNYKILDFFNNLIILAKQLSEDNNIEQQNKIHYGLGLMSIMPPELNAGITKIKKDIFSAIGNDRPINIDNLTKRIKLAAEYCEAINLYGKIFSRDLNEINNEEIKIALMNENANIEVINKLIDIFQEKIYDDIRLTTQDIQFIRSNRYEIRYIFKLLNTIINQGASFTKIY